MQLAGSSKTVILKLAKESDFDDSHVDHYLTVAIDIHFE